MNKIDETFELFGLNEEIAKGARKTYNLGDDWVYRDVRWFDETYWNKFLELLGEGNYIILMMSNKCDKDGTRRLGGQFMISEQGLQNIRTYNKSKMN